MKLNATIPAVRLPAEHLGQLVDLANAEDLTISDMVRRAIGDLIRCGQRDRREAPRETA